MGIIDFVKMYPDLYNAPHGKAVFVTKPRFSYLTISGQGHTIEDEGLQAAMTLLVGVAFSMKCDLKFNPPENFIDYIMPPLELMRYNTDKKKSDRKWRLLLPQPDYINEEMVNKAFEIAKKKNPDQIIAKLGLFQIDETFCIQTMHTGSYEKEKTTIAFLKKEAKKNGTDFIGELHETYLNDPRRTGIKKLQTIIRFQVKKLPVKEQPAPKPAKAEKPLKIAKVKPAKASKAKSAKKALTTKKKPAPKKMVAKKKSSGSKEKSSKKTITKKKKK